MSVCIAVPYLLQGKGCCQGSQGEHKAAAKSLEMAATKLNAQLLNLLFARYCCTVLARIAVCARV